MAEHGGYRKPTNPAAVSGPGAHSRRTDTQPHMQLPDAGYGEQADFQQIQSGAAIPKANQQTSTGGSAQAVPPVTGLGAPTEQPGTPVTAGAALGPGPGQEALNLPQQDPDQLDAQALQKYLPTLIDIAMRDDTLPSTKQWVRGIIANLG